MEISAIATDFVFVFNALTYRLFLPLANFRSVVTKRKLKDKHLQLSMALLLAHAHISVTGYWTVCSCFFCSSFYQNAAENLVRAITR